MRLNHIALTVADRERSAAFYERYFGMSARVHEDEHLLILASASGCLLALSQGTPVVDVPRTTHFGFRCDSVDDVLVARQRFSDDGIVEANGRTMDRHGFRFSTQTAIALNSTLFKGPDPNVLRTS